MGYVVDKEYLELLYEPCQSKEELRQHMITFLDVDLPDYTVDEESTSNPMEFIWSVYHTMLTDKGPHRVVAACARNSTKTLSATIIRFYGMIHFRRSGTHLAATLEQSDSAVMYLDKFLEIDGVKEHLVVSNSRRKILKGLPPNSFTKNHECMLRVAVATKKGVNSQRGSLNTKDETGLLPKEIISESAYIADPTRDEHRFNPIEINLSSRKAPDDMMEDLIEEATSVGASKELRLHKWSMVDFMQQCPPAVHLPDEPRQAAFLNTDTLEVMWGAEEFEGRVPASERSQYKPIAAYAGCRTCPVFVACQARSIKQQSQSQTLRSIEFTDLILKGVKDADSLISQALNWRPGKSGQVFKMFRNYRHVHQPIQAWTWLFGTPFNPKGLSGAELAEATRNKPWTVTPTKDDFYNKLTDEGWLLNYGTDWGFRPAWATNVLVFYHRRQQRAFLFHVAADQGMPNNAWADRIIEDLCSKWPPDLICPDTEDPAAPSYFSKRGFSARDKKPPKIATGVSQLRGLLFDPQLQKERFIILDDGSEATKMAIEAFNKWSHLKTALGFNFDKFDDNNFCDFIDPVRYALDPFIHETRIGYSANVSLDPNNKQMLAEEAHKGNEEAKEIIRRKNSELEQLNHLFFKETGVENLLTPPPEEAAEDTPYNGKSSKKSRIKFSF